MAAKPQVTLTFAGDSSDLEQSFDRVGQSADGMRREVGNSSDGMRREFGTGIDGMIDKSDTLDTRAMGFRDTVTGISDTFRGLNDETLTSEQRLLMLGMGVGDLASGFTNLLLPALKNIAGFMKGGLLKAFTLLSTHPLLLVLGLLIAAFVLLWMNSETFRDIVIGVFNTVRDFIVTAFGVARDFVLSSWENITAFFSELPGRIGGFFTQIGDNIRTAFNNAVAFVRGLWDGYVAFLSGLPGRVAGFFTRIGQFVRDQFNNAVAFVRGLWDGLVSFLSGLPGRIGGFFTQIGDNIRAGFRNAINDVIGWWNRLSFTAPTISVPGFEFAGFTYSGFSVGGQTFSTPNIPFLHSGGIVPGTPGQDVLSMLEAGERVIPRGGGPVLEIRSGGSALDDLLVDVLRAAVRRQGGNVQDVLGG